MRTNDQVAVTGRAVAVLLDGESRTPTPWPDDHRALLLEGGPQAPEFLVTGE
jgi:hypothetical protein